MDLELKPTTNTNIEELMSLLRSIFRPKQLDKVEQMLKEKEANAARRERELQAENDRMKKKYDLIEKEHGNLVFDKLKMESELVEYKGKCEQLSEQVTRLSEDQRVCCERETRANERYEKLLQDLMASENQKKETILQLKDKDKELLDWKRKFKELEVRVVRLEKETNILASGISNCHEKREAGNCAEIIEIDDDNATPTGKRKKGNPVWAFEVDLLRALETDDQLCMNGVCALYRHQTSVWKAFKDPTSSIVHGCSQLDIERVTNLAYLLTNKDPQGKMKKTVWELQQNDPKVLNDCRKVAMRYPRQLFEIYQKGDPFFHP